MSDSFEFTLHNPLTKEDWNKLSDAELENTMSVTFQTPQGKQVRYIKCEVLDKIRAEIKALMPKPTAYDVVDGNPVKDAVWEILIEVDKVLDKYKAESEGKDADSN